MTEVFVVNEDKYTDWTFDVTCHKQLETRKDYSEDPPVELPNPYYRKYEPHKWSSEIRSIVNSVGGKVTEESLGPNALVVSGKLPDEDAAYSLVERLTGIHDQDELADIVQGYSWNRELLKRHRGYAWHTHKNRHFDTERYKDNHNKSTKYNVDGITIGAPIKKKSDVPKAELILRLIASKPNGMTRKEIVSAVLKLQDPKHEYNWNSSDRGYWGDYLNILLPKFCEKQPDGRWKVTKDIKGPYSIRDYEKGRINTQDLFGDD